MDIFTTALTRVVPIPIKGEKLKVKALLKEPAINKLTDDIDHLENHDSYFHFAVYDRSGHQHQSDDNKKAHDENDKDNKQGGEEEHLDIFV